MEFNLDHDGVEKAWVWGGGSFGKDSFVDNLSVLFKNGHEEVFRVESKIGRQNIDVFDILIKQAKEYIFDLNGKMPELTDEELLYATEEDWAFYNKAIEGLPTREGFKGNFLDKDNVELPYGSGPHILKHFRDALNITKATSVLEIGFNFGHGAAMLLQLGASVDSVDISQKWETKYASLFLQNKTYLFRYFSRSELPIDLVSYYDLVFIDGAHDEQSIIKDIQLSNKLRIPYLLFDDWYPRYGDTQKAVAKFPELELVKDMNNLMLFKWKD